jgi:hypothetical protein
VRIVRRGSGSVVISIIWRNNHAYDERLRHIGDGQTWLDAALVTDLKGD